MAAIEVSYGPIIDSLSEGHVVTIGGAAPESAGRPAAVREEHFENSVGGPPGASAEAPTPQTSVAPDTPERPEEKAAPSPAPTTPSPAPTVAKASVGLTALPTQAPPKQKATAPKARAQCDRRPSAGDRQKREGRTGGLVPRDCRFREPG